MARRQNTGTKTAPGEFRRLLRAPEGANLEFKSAVSGFSFDELLKYCAALANEGGGKILLGVSDRRPRKVPGTQAFAEPGRTAAGLFERLDLHISVEEYSHENARVLIVHVPSREIGDPIQCNGAYWMRAGDALVPMKAARLRKIFLENAPDYSAEMTDATMADLDGSAISDFRRRWAKKSGSVRISELTDEKTLVDAGLMKDGKLTRAALMLCGTEPAVRHHVPRFEVIFEYRSTRAAGPAQDRHEYREGFLRFHDTIWERINLRNDKQSYQERFFRFDIHTFDEESTREAILNAVCHRDYRSLGSIFVRQYTRHLEIVSPGGFPPGINTENLLDRHTSRNPLLTEALLRTGLIERAGQGLNLIYERSIRQSKSMPDFTRTDDYQVFLTLNGTMTDPAFVLFMQHIPPSPDSRLDTQDYVLLELIHRGDAVPRELRPRLAHLREQGLVESSGNGRGTYYRLGRDFRSKTDIAEVAPADRSSNRESFKALLLAYLIEAEPTGAKLDEIHQTAPRLSRRQLQGILAELRAEKRVELLGSTKGARWHALARAQAESAIPDQNAS